MIQNYNKTKSLFAFLDSLVSRDWGISMRVSVNKANVHVGKNVHWVHVDTSVISGITTKQ